MKKIGCNTITKFDCTYSIYLEKDDDKLITFLTHINEIHDPSFVARCQDDLIVEYNKYVMEIKALLIN